MRPRGQPYRELKKYVNRPSVSAPLISLDLERTERYSYDCMALRSPKTGPWLAAPPRGRALYEGVQAPGALSFFKKPPRFSKVFQKFTMPE